MKQLTRIKVRRFFRRSSNRLIEQIIKAVKQLEKNLEALDAEQDELNALADAEIARIRADGEAHRKEMERRMAESARLEAEAIGGTQELFGSLGKVNAEERAAAAKVRDNLKSIIE